MDDATRDSSLGPNTLCPPDKLPLIPSQPNSPGLQNAEPGRHCWPYMPAGGLSPRWSPRSAETGLRDRDTKRQLPGQMCCQVPFWELEVGGLTCAEAVAGLRVKGPCTGPGPGDPEAAEHARPVSC